ncbi:hypothetical protein RJT34_05260 [Clitoria ternatea]|uniref:Uncharacterized protein n=1 Tax=Clitoria ternatea TaxID=43366 RepID=A0AAN9K2S4_CLITE
MLSPSEVENEQPMTHVVSLEIGLAKSEQRKMYAAFAEVRVSGNKYRTLYDALSELVEFPTRYVSGCTESYLKLCKSEV